MKENKFKVKNLFKSRIFFFVLGLFLASIVGVSAVSLLYSSDVTYDNTSSGLSATTVQEALDELYEQVKSAPSCDSEGNCTVTCPNGTTFVSTSTGYWCGVKAGDQILANVNIVTSGDGLYADSTEDGRYFYSGTNPNNKIVFNGEPYRILSIELDGRIKIMKMVSVGKKSWHGTGTVTTWPNSSLNTYLNEDWLSAQINKKDYLYLAFNNEWYIGAVPSSFNSSTIYTYEKKETSISTVGLISVSEYFKSKSSGNTFLSYSNGFWTISRDDSSYAWYVASNYIYNNNVLSISFDIFPVLYLKSTVSLTGSGTATDPYCISGSSCPTNLNFTQRAS